jgi:hypothetical protein
MLRGFRTYMHIVRQAAFAAKALNADAEGGCGWRDACHDRGGRLFRREQREGCGGYRAAVSKGHSFRGAKEGRGIQVSCANGRCTNGPMHF